MKKKIRRQVTTETKQIALVIDSMSNSGSKCEICSKDSRMVSPLLAARLLQTDTREIYRLIERNEIHFVETPTKQLFVCLTALQNALAKPRKALAVVEKS
ncbi:MAG: hypothetical protein M3209_01165 [Acidobacteriota bacterium]|nr:hypothetical protein [Acidobacteriota bacterium]